MGWCRGKWQSQVTLAILVTSQILGSAFKYCWFYTPNLEFKWSNLTTAHIFLKRGLVQLPVTRTFLADFLVIFWIRVVEVKILQKRSLSQKDVINLLVTVAREYMPKDIPFLLYSNLHLHWNDNFEFFSKMAETQNTEMRGKILGWFETVWAYEQCFTWYNYFHPGSAKDDLFGFLRKLVTLPETNIL